jgi:hypothetical protein
VVALWVHGPDEGAAGVVKRSITTMAPVMDSCKEVMFELDIELSQTSVLEEPKSIFQAPTEIAHLDEGTCTRCFLPFSSPSVA